MQCHRCHIDFQSCLSRFVVEKEQFDFGIHHTTYTSDTADDTSETWTRGNEDDIRVLGLEASAEVQSVEQKEK